MQTRRRRQLCWTLYLKREAAGGHLPLNVPRASVSLLLLLITFGKRLAGIVSAYLLWNSALLVLFMKYILNSLFRE